MSRDVNIRWSLKKKAETRETTERERGKRRKENPKKQKKSEKKERRKGALSELPEPSTPFLLLSARAAMAPPPQLTPPLLHCEIPFLFLVKKKMKALLLVDSFSHFVNN
jgi:hypothetical protein